MLQHVSSIRGFCGTRWSSLVDVPRVETAHRPSSVDELTICPSAYIPSTRRLRHYQVWRGHLIERSRHRRRNGEMIGTGGNLFGVNHRTRYYLFLLSWKVTPTDEFIRTFPEYSRWQDKVTDLYNIICNEKHECQNHRVQFRTTTVSVK